MKKTLAFADESATHFVSKVKNLEIFLALQTL